jgi:hypothetical protein
VLSANLEWRPILKKNAAPEGRVACASNDVTGKRPVGKTSDGCDASGETAVFSVVIAPPLTPASCSPMEISSLADTADPQRTETTAVAAAIERCLMSSSAYSQRPCSLGLEGRSGSLPPVAELDDVLAGIGISAR